MSRVQGSVNSCRGERERGQSFCLKSMYPPSVVIARKPTQTRAQPSLARETHAAPRPSSNAPPRACSNAAPCHQPALCPPLPTPRSRAPRTDGNNSQAMPPPAPTAPSLPAPPHSFRTGSRPSRCSGVSRSSFRFCGRRSSVPEAPRRGSEAEALRPRGLQQTHTQWDPSIFPDKPGHRRRQAATQGNQRKDVDRTWGETKGGSQGSNVVDSLQHQYRARQSSASAKTRAPAQASLNPNLYRGTRRGPSQDLGSRTRSLLNPGPAINKS